MNLLLLLCFLLPQLPNNITKITQQNPLMLGGLTINPHIIAAIPGLLHSNCTTNQKIKRIADQNQGENVKKGLPILKGICSTSGRGCRHSMMSSTVLSYCRGTSPPVSSHTDLLSTAPEPSTSPFPRLLFLSTMMRTTVMCASLTMPWPHPPSVAGPRPPRWQEP